MHNKSVGPAATAVCVRVRACMMCFQYTIKIFDPG